MQANHKTKDERQWSGKEGQDDSTGLDAEQGSGSMELAGGSHASYESMTANLDASEDCSSCSGPTPMCSNPRKIVVKVGKEEMEVMVGSVREFEISVGKIFKQRKIEAHLLLPVKIILLERASWLGPDFKALQERLILQYTHQRFSAIPS